MYRIFGEIVFHSVKILRILPSCTGHNASMMRSKGRGPPVMRGKGRGPPVVRGRGGGLPVG